MNNIDYQLDEIEWENEPSFEASLHETLSPKVKQYLLEFHGDILFDLQPETYLAIDLLIKKNISLGSVIPDILYRNRTIRDPDEFDQALDNFVPDQAPISWPLAECWFNRQFIEDDNENTYLEDSNPIDLTEKEIKAKQIVEAANKLIEHHRNFAHFMKSGYEILNKEIQQFLEKCASFDLAILSDEGFQELQNYVYSLINTLLEELYALIPES